MSRNNKALPRPTMQQRQPYGKQSIAEFERGSMYAAIIMGVMFGLCLALWLVM